MKGLILYRDLKLFFIYMTLYMSTIVICVISELSEILRIRYTLVAVFSQLIKNETKLTFFLYGIVQSIC